MTLFRMEEWQSPIGDWHCGHVASFPKNVQLWVCPARILGMPADEYVKWMIETYKRDKIYWSGKLFTFSWKSQAQMRKFKNYINAQSRKVNYQI